MLHKVAQVMEEPEAEGTQHQMKGEEKTKDPRLCYALTDLECQSQVSVQCQANQEHLQGSIK